MRHYLNRPAVLLQCKRWRVLAAAGIAAVIAAGPVCGEPCPSAPAPIEAESCSVELELNADDLIAAFQRPVTTGRTPESRPQSNQTGVALPLAVDPGDGGVSVKSSLGQWRTFDAQMLAARVEGATAMLPGALALPKPAAASPTPVDVWTRLDVQGLAHDSDKTVRSGMGADYQVNAGAVVGIAVARADTRLAIKPASAQPMSAGDDTVAAHVLLQASPLLSIDTRTQWETGTTLSHASPARIDNNSVSVAPRLKLPFALDSGQTVEPFVTVKDERVHGPTAQDAAEPGTRNIVSAGAGVTLSRPNAYTMSVTAGVEGLGASDAPNMKSRVQLDIPLR